MASAAVRPPTELHSGVNMTNGAVPRCRRSIVINHFIIIFIERYKNQQIHYPRCRQRSVHWLLNLVSRYDIAAPALPLSDEPSSCWHCPGCHQDMWDQYSTYVSAKHRFPFFEVLKILTKSFTDIHWLISTSGDPMCSTWRCAMCKILYINPHLGNKL